MMFGKYKKGGETLPRVMHISVARFQPHLPKDGEPLDFLVSIHEEGTGVTWQQNITVEPDTETYLLETTRDLYLWSRKLGLTLPKSNEHIRQLGERLHQVFIGPQGEKYLKGIEPTAVLLNVDETILNLPWELIRFSDGPLAREIPFGRLVTTRVMPRRGRDPLEEDARVRILAVANPTMDLPSCEAELQAIQANSGSFGAGTVEVDVLIREKATRAVFAEMLATGDYDILHFAGHAYLDQAEPESSALLLADGPLTADEVLELPWKAPPYIVFNSACETGRAVGGKRLVSGELHSNGLAAGFLAAGAAAYAGYFWPVTDSGASLFAETFYQSLFMRENVGLAFLDARNRAILELGEAGDLTGYSAVLYGDAASQHRRDLAMAA